MFYKNFSKKITSVSYSCFLQNILRVSYIFFLHYFQNDQFMEITEAFHPQNNPLGSSGVNSVNDPLR